MSQSTNFANRIKNACSGFIMRRMHKCNIGILSQCFFYCIQIRSLIQRKSQVYIRKSVILAYFYCSCAVRAIVYHQYTLSFRQKRIDAYIYIQRTRAAKQYTCVFVGIAVNDPDQILSQVFHKPRKFLFARANIRHNLCQLNRIGRGGRSRVKQYVSFYNSIIHLHISSYLNFDKT